MKKFLSMILCLVAAGSAAAAPSDAVVKSPDGHLCLRAGVNGAGRLYYTLSRDNRALIDTSFLAIEAREGAVGIHSALKGVSRDSLDETWTQPWGEEAEVRNRYNGMTLSLAESRSGITGYSVEFRVFDDGIGFRYVIPAQGAHDTLTITDEITQFNLHDDATAWSQPWDHEYYEHTYDPAPVSRTDTVSTPLTLKVADDLYMAIHESNLVDYAEMNLRGDGGTRLVSYLTPWSTGEKVFATLPLKTPWRTVIVADSPGALALSRIEVNLADPCAIADTSWIEPGRYVGIWWGMHMKDWTWASGPQHGATTENARRYIDFAAANGYSGVLVEGWNKGWDGDWTANGDIFSFTEAYDDFDLPGVAAYARSKGVRLIGHNETAGGTKNYEAQMDSAFALYRSLGMNTVKTGYVNRLLDGKELHGSQYGVRHYRKVVETAARHHIMICNHEGVMPTGWRRTYPNIVAHEDMRGQEYDAWSPDGGNPPEHTCTLPFTRGLAGPMDYTPGTMDYTNPAAPGTHPQTTIAKQLALAVVLHSPIVMSSDKVENYEGRPEAEFLRRCPTNWQRSLYLEGAIGEYVTVARQQRGGNDWFIGAITNARPRETTLTLDFLDPDATYTARIYADGEGADYRTNPYPVSISDITVRKGDTLPLRLAPSGGAAVILTRN